MHLLMDILVAWVLAIANSAAMKLGYMCLFQFWFLQGIRLVVELLSHMTVLFLVFLRNLHSGSINLHCHQQCKKFPFSPHPIQY